MDLNYSCWAPKQIPFNSCKLCSESISPDVEAFKHLNSTCDEWGNCPGAPRVFPFSLFVSSLNTRKKTPKKTTTPLVSDSPPPLELCGPRVQLSFLHSFNFQAFRGNLGFLFFFPNREICPQNSDTRSVPVKTA